MTVEKLIEELNKVEDKTLKVHYMDSEWALYDTEIGSARITDDYTKDLIVILDN